MRTLLLALLLVALAAPAARAHEYAFEDATRDAEGGLVELFLEGAPLATAASPLTLRIQLAEERAVENVRARLGAPGDPAGAPIALDPDPETPRGNDWTTRLAFARAGDWRIEVEADGAVETFLVPVHPEGRWFVSLAEGEPGVVVRDDDAREVRLRLQDAHGRPAPEVDDARALLDGPAGRTSAAPLRPLGGGVYALSAPDTVGEHRARIESATLSLAAGDRPPVPLLVEDPAATTVYETPARAETPAAGLALVAVVSAAAAMLARRRA